MFSLSAKDFATPVASVQMLAYNHGPYIERAVEGVLAQKTEFPFELVIGEDCSTDATRQIALAYEKKYPGSVRVVTSERNVGMHRNALRVQEACRGRFLAFCEADDYWHDPSKLQTQVAFLERHSDYGLAHCNYDSFEVSTSRRRKDAIPCSSSLQDDQGYLEILLRKRRVLTLTVCVRSELLRKVVSEQAECSDEQWPMGDTQRWLEISRLTQLKYFPLSMATHNFLSESASQSRDPAKAFRFTERAGQLILHYLEKYPVPAAADQLIRARICLEVLAAAHQAGDNSKAAFWMEELRNTSTRLPFEAYLYSLRTQGPLGEFAVKSVIWTLSRSRGIKERLFRVWQMAAG